MNSNGDRLDQIEMAIQQLINLQRNQIDINAAFQIQLAQLAEQQRLTSEQVRTTSAGLEQLERTVDYLMRRDRDQNGGTQA